MSIANCLRLLAACLILAPAPLSAQRSGDAVFAVHVVQRGENLFQIALQYDRLPEAIAKANGISDSESLAVGQRLIIPLSASLPRQPVRHVVAAGETLVGIAAAYDRSLSDILGLEPPGFSRSHIHWARTDDCPRFGRDSRQPTRRTSADARAREPARPRRPPFIFACWRRRRLLRAPREIGRNALRNRAALQSDHRRAGTRQQSARSRFPQRGSAAGGARASCCRS